MIAKILNKSSPNFSAVQYNDNKVEKGTGELLGMKNFPAHMNASSSQSEVRDYLMSIQPVNKKVTNKQFHCTLSAEGRTQSKEVLNEMANRFMDKMGYGKQPYIVVFHNDTNNNHVHIVSTRIDKENFKAINQDFEKYRAQTSMREVLKELYGIDHNEKIEKLLAYNYSNSSQLEKLLESGGYASYVKDENLNITHNGVPLKIIKVDDIVYNQDRDEKRKKQIYSILNRFKSNYSNNVFQVNDPQSKKVSYTSELQKELREKLGLEIVFSYKEDKLPFGYTIIDHKTNSLFKGGEIMKMNTLFNITPESIDKRFFDILNNYNVANKVMKEALLKYLESNAENTIKDYMVFGNKSKVPYNIYEETRNNAVNYIRNYGNKASLADGFSIVDFEDKHFLINEKEHKIFDLNKLVGDRYYSQYVNNVNTPHSSVGLQQQEVQINSNHSILNDLLKLNSASEYGSSGVSQEEDEMTKKRKKKRR